MTNESKSKERFFGVKLLIVTALAFLAALAFRRSAGIIAMTPIMLVLCGASAFIGISTALKCAVFGVMVFTVNSIETPSALEAAIFAALCILACAVFGFAATAIRAKKKQGVPILCGGAVVCILLNLYLVGNPFAAYKANQSFKEYTDKNYAVNENSGLGNFEFSKIYYRYDTKAYVIDVVSDKYPTEGASLTLGNDVICDGFKSVMEEKVSEQYVSKISAALREAFPKGDFEVSFERFVTLPEQAVLSAEAGALSKNVCYEIQINGIQTREAMLKAVNGYVNAIDRSGVGYARLTFKSGIGNWQRRYIAIDPNHPPFRAEAELLYCNTASSNFFCEYLYKLQRQ